MIINSVWKNPIIIRYIKSRSDHVSTITDIGSSKELKEAFRASSLISNTIQKLWKKDERIIKERWENASTFTIQTLTNLLLSMWEVHQWQWSSENYLWSIDRSTSDRVRYGCLSIKQSGSLTSAPEIQEVIINLLFVIHGSIFMCYIYVLLEIYFLKYRKRPRLFWMFYSHFKCLWLKFEIIVQKSK